MKKLDIAIIRLLQFFVFVIFTFAVLIYFSAMVLLPLSLVALLINICSIFGLNSLISALIAIPIVSYIVIAAYKIPLLGKIVLDTGVDLISTGKMRVEAFNTIEDSVKK